jgi:hypothetical protein
MTESDLKSMIEDIILLGKITNGNIYHWKSILKDAASIWKKAPFKVGQLVKLSRTPEITKDKSWGWLGSKHFLIKGAIARIEESSFYGGQFVYGLHFMDESHLSFDGSVHQVDQRAVYSFGESWLESAEYNSLTCEAL